MKNKVSKQVNEYVNYFPTKRVIIKPFFKCQIDTTNYMLFKQNEIEIHYDDNLYTIMIHTLFRNYDDSETI